MRKQIFIALALCLIGFLLYCSTDKITGSASAGFRDSCMVTTNVLFKRAAVQVSPDSVARIVLTITYNNVTVADTFPYSSHEGVLKAIPVNVAFTVRIEGLDQNNAVLYYGIRSNSGITDDITIEITANEVSPIAPTDLRLQALSATGVQINWKDNSSNEMGFIVERSITSDSHFVAIDTTIANLHATVDDQGLTANTIYYYRVKAFNSAGASPFLTAQAVRTLNVTEIDTIPPVLLISALPDSVKLDSIAITGKTYDKSGIFKVTVNDSAATLGTDSTFVRKTGLTEGTNIIRVTAVDNSSGKNDTTIMIHVVYSLTAVDTTHPVITFSSPKDKDTVLTLSPTLTGTVNDPGGAISLFKVNNGAVVLVGINWSAPVTLNTTGWNSIAVEAVDGSSNKTIDTLHLYADTTTKDTAKPVINFSPLTAGYFFGISNPTLNVTVTDNGSGVDSVYIKGIMSTKAGNLYSATIGLMPDSNFITVIAKDQAGNSAKDSILLILNRPPAFSTSTNEIKSQTYVGQEYRDSVVATDPDGSVGLAYLKLAGPSGMVVDINKGVITWTPVSVSTVKCSVVVTDKYQAKDTIAWNISVVAQSDTITYGLKRISAGFFTDDNGYTATIAHDFWIDSTEVTQADFEKLMGNRTFFFDGHPNRPAEMLSWFDAITYCNARSKAKGYDTVYTYTAITYSSATGLVCDWGKTGFRLPTEDEWELACRAGTTSTYYWGSTMNSAYGWYLSNSGDSTRTVMSKLPNAAGLYDMAGNVFEWCWDWYGTTGRSNGRSDFRGSTSGTERVLRGGCINSTEPYLQSAYRFKRNPDYQNQGVGLRCVLPTDVVNIPPKVMKLIPSGTFQMGSNANIADAQPVHFVTISMFYMDSTEVTQEDFQALMGVNPSSFVGNSNPVEMVTLGDVQLYCNARSKHEGLDTVYRHTGINGTFPNSTGLYNLFTDITKNGYRLPSEAEWEYACRAGTATDFYWGNDSSPTTVSKYAWYAGNSSSTTHAVAQKIPNAFGLYDMTGNVWEWTNNGIAAYPSNAQVDPPPVFTGSRVILRGGAYPDAVATLRSAVRVNYGPDFRTNQWGFRCVRRAVMGAVNHAPYFIQDSTSMNSTDTVSRQYCDTVHAVDPDGNTVTFSFVSSVTGMVLTDSIITWTPGTADTGCKHVSVKVSDGSGSSSTLSWSVSVTKNANIVVDPGGIFTVDANTVALWRMDNLGASDTLYDVSGNSHNGKISNAVWASGIKNQCLQFDSTGRVDVPHSTDFDFTDNFSVEIWANQQVHSQYHRTLLAQGLAYSTNYCVGVDSQSFVYFENYDGAPYRGGPVIPLNTWHYYAMTYVSHTIKLFVDGVLVKQMAKATDPQPSPTYPLTIGKEYRGEPWGFVGKIDEIRISKTARSESEISAVWAASGGSINLTGMKLIPGGTFQMGQPNPDVGGTGLTVNEQPVHSVTVNSFYMDTSEVTQQSFQALMGINPSYNKSNNRNPVEMVTWFDAVLYCNKRSKIEDRDTVYAYTGIVGVAGNGCTGLTGLSINMNIKGCRLPTEAEWEFACRSGTTTDYYWAGGTTGNYSWYNMNSGGTTHPIGGKLPNTFGLYDMNGNVWEWCNDWYGDYSNGVQVDPTGATSGSARVMRGGACDGIDLVLRSTYRGYGSPGFLADYYRGYGFRVVCRP